MKKLGKYRKKKLDSLEIVCICGERMRVGTPKEIYDDFRECNPETHEYHCMICDRSFTESDKLLWTCAQNILPLHMNGFFICYYCIWIQVTYTFINHPSIHIQHINCTKI